MSVRRITQPRYHNADLWRTSSGRRLHGFMKETGWQTIWRPWNGGFDVVLERSHRKLYKLPCERIDLDLLMSAIDLILFNMLQIITAFYCLAPKCNPSSIYGPLKIGAIISYHPLVEIYFLSYSFAWPAWTLLLYRWFMTPGTSCTRRHKPSRHLNNKGICDFAQNPRLRISNWQFGDIQNIVIHKKNIWTLLSWSFDPIFAPE